MTELVLDIECKGLTKLNRNNKERLKIELH